MQTGFSDLQSRIRLCTACAGLLLSVLGATAATAGKVFEQAGLAIRGYDPVAYFTEQRAVEGSPGITQQWGGATWQFASSANRDRFVADSGRYAPQYGGHCAYAAANNYIAPTDPQAWTVHNDKLYLNFSKSVRARWKKDIGGNIARGDQHWPQLMQER